VLAFLPECLQFNVTGENRERQKVFIKVNEKLTNFLLSFLEIVKNCILP